MGTFVGIVGKTEVPKEHLETYVKQMLTVWKYGGNDAVYPYVDPDRITTMFLFATSPLLSQSGNTKSSIKGNTPNSDSLNRESPCSSSLYKRRHCLPSVTAQTRLLLFNKCLWLHKQKIKSHHSSTRSATILASLTARASRSLFSSPVFCSMFATWNLTVDISQPISAAMRV